MKDDVVLDYERDWEELKKKIFEDELDEKGDDLLKNIICEVIVH